MKPIQFIKVAIIVVSIYLCACGGGAQDAETESPSEDPAPYPDSVQYEYSPKDAPLDIEGPDDTDERPDTAIEKTEEEEF